MPTAAVVAGPEPEMAPKNMQAITAAAPRPPAAGPASSSAIRIRRRAMPASPIRAPARMKDGSAISGKELIAENASSTSEVMSSPLTT